MWRYPAPLQNTTNDPLFLQTNLTYTLSPELYRKTSRHLVVKEQNYCQH